MKRFKKTSWGWWVVLFNHRHFKVKLLRFKKRQHCSRQVHCHRSELWLLIKGYGTLDIQISRDVFDKKYLIIGDFAIVPEYMTHQFTAIRPCLVLEVQYGKECREDDIVRIQ